MNDSIDTTERRRLNDLSFFGKIMANVSHEFNNVLTVISELSGLLQDLSELAERGRPIQPEKLKQITQKFSHHLARGKELISHMNRFSHSVDDPRITLDPKDIVENMQVLMQRLVDRRQATLDCDYSGNGSMLTTDPFAVRHALFACFELLMQASSTTPAFQINLSSEERGTRIVVSSDSAFDAAEDESKWLELTDTVRQFGGQVALDRLESGVFITITVPITLNDGISETKG